MTANGVRAAALALAFLLTGCLGPDTPEEQLESIEALQAKKLPMTDEQKALFSKHLENGRKALAAGNKEEAGKAFDAALAILKVAEDTALFNKAD